MSRIKDYTGFAAWFSGLGYIVLWPLTAPDIGGMPFGASILCRDGGFALLDFLCNSAHPLRLPPALHAIGILSAAFVAVRLILYAVRRWRRARATVAIDASVLKARLLATPARPLWPRTASRLRPVKPRAHFGLRGVPR